MFNFSQLFCLQTVAINDKKSATSPSVVDLQKPEVFNEAAKDLIFNLEEIKRLLSKKKEEISQECRTVSINSKLKCC